jgi:MFS family permease
MYLELPIFFALLKSYPHLRQWATPVGIILMCLSLTLASFAKTVTQLILTQGVLYALGGGFGWVTVLFYVEEWFVQKRSLAYGIIMVHISDPALFSKNLCSHMPWQAGLGLAGVVLPLIIEWLLTQYGHKTTLRACSLGIFILTAPLTFFFKPRLPSSQTSQLRKFDITFLKSRSFTILQLGNVIEALGYFLPAVYLPSYARSLGAGDFQSTLPLILINAGAFFGNLCMGAFVARWHVTTCILISTVGSTASVLLIWGLASSLAPLYVFCIIYGLSAGCWSTVSNSPSAFNTGN